MTIELFGAPPLPIANWDIIWPYAGLEVCAIVEPHLPNQAKTAAFRHILDDDRHLKIFFRSLLQTGTFGVQSVSSKVKEHLQHYPRWLTEEDRALCRTALDGQPLPDTPETAASIRRILSSQLHEYVFKHVTRMDYGLNGAVEQPTYLHPALQSLTQLETLSFNQTIYHAGVGEFATPMDLRPFPNLSRLRMPNTDIREGDLLLSKTIIVRSRWPESTMQKGEWFHAFPKPVAPQQPAALPPPAETIRPSPTFVEQCQNWMRSICSSVINFFSWLFYCEED